MALLLAPRPRAELLSQRPVAAAVALLARLANMALVGIARTICDPSATNLARAQDLCGPAPGPR